MFVLSSGVDRIGTAHRGAEQTLARLRVAAAALRLLALGMVVVVLIGMGRDGAAETSLSWRKLVLPDAHAHVEIGDGWGLFTDGLETIWEALTPESGDPARSRWSQRAPER